MDAKKKDKLATAIIYILVGIVVLILAGILGDILITGIPHLSWHFLSSKPHHTKLVVGYVINFSIQFIC